MIDTLSDTVGTVLIATALVLIGAGAALVAPRIARASGAADRLIALQLLSAKAIALCVGLSVLLAAPALADMAMVLALLGAVAAAVFAQGVDGDGGA